MERIEGQDAPRCAWAGTDPLYIRYHDQEWGRPTADDHRLFEKLCLEGFQAGLSWITILCKRERFRERFHGFDVERVAAMGESDVASLLEDAGLIRHRGKIEAAIGNARAVLALREATGRSLAAFLWSFEPPASERPAVVDGEFIRRNPETATSQRLSRALRARGFRFVGPTTAYAFLQSMGFVNDHVEGCCVREACEHDRAVFQRPDPPELAAKTSIR